MTDLPPERAARVDEFLDALGDDDLQRLVTFMACPHCGAEYPEFHSPVGKLTTLCDRCGWGSEEADA